MEALHRPEMLAVDVGPQSVTDILTRPIYAGYVEASRWDVSPRKGQHEARISPETFERIQQRLTEATKAPYRKDLNAGFVLRGAISCADCSGALTACGSRSGTGKLHPCYLCHTRGCISARRSIPRSRIEEKFETLLRSLQPTPGLFAIAKAMFRSAWDQRKAQADGIALGLKRELTDIETQTDRLLQRIIATDSAAVVTVYEKKIAQLEGRQCGPVRWPDEPGRASRGPACRRGCGACGP